MNTIYREKDVVYHYHFGKGIIESISIEDVAVPIKAQFPGKVIHFTLDGCDCYNTPTLSFTPYDLINGGFSQERPKPEIEKGMPVFVKTENSLHWMVGKFYEWHGSGKMVGIVGLDGNTRFYADYSLENPLK